MPCRIHALTLPALFTVLAASAGHAQEAQARLWNAAVSGDTVALVQAIDAGAVVDSLDVRSNPNGRRALNWAAWNNRVPVIRILVAHGATVNGSNLTGFSPLHHAAESGSLEAALALLTAGADPQRLNNDGETPSAVARRRGFTALADSIDAAAKRADTLRHHTTGSSVVTKNRVAVMSAKPPSSGATILPARRASCASRHGILRGDMAGFRRMVTISSTTVAPG